MAFEKIRREFDLLVARARDSVLDISGFRYGGCFLEPKKASNLELDWTNF